MSTGAPDAVELPDGMEYGDKGLIVRGLVARDLAHHLLLPRPKRIFPTCILDHLGAQTMTGMHLARIEPDGVKCDHRHLDETLSFMVTGSGYTEFRQADDAPLTRVDWGPGDLLVIPTNAYHRHVNGPQGPSRQLSFRNVQVMNTLLHGTSTLSGSKGAVYEQDGARFVNRFADEPDYFTLREDVGPGVVRANFVPRIADEPLADEDGRLGDGVAVVRYLMGGQRMLDVSVVGIRSGGSFRPHRPMAEEAFVVLAGSGRTDVWRGDDADAAARSVGWTKGDLVAPPMGVWRSHHATGADDVRLLRVRNLVLTRALGVDDDLLDLPVLPDRFPEGVIDAAENGAPLTVDEGQES